jgi:hypothetical protein
MKTMNHLLVAAAAAFALNVALATEASNNTALLHSPRYLEEHPELLRAVPPSVESPAHKAKRLTEPTKNTALANSPRFREEHPELLWAASPAEQRTTVSEGDRLIKLTENKALAASPRFREEHPELFRGEPMVEIAPLK